MRPSIKGKFYDTSGNAQLLFAPTWHPSRARSSDADIIYLISVVCSYVLTGKRGFFRLLEGIFLVKLTAYPEKRRGAYHQPSLLNME